jgi:hypothetical protein
MTIKQQYFDPLTVAKVACELEGIEWQDLVGATRRKDVALLRSRLAGYLHEVNHSSWPEIATAMGKRYHSTFHTAYHKRWLKESHEDRQAFIARLEIAVCKDGGSGAHLTFATTYPPLALHSLADKLETGRIGIGAAVLTLRKIAEACDHDIELRRLQTENSNGLGRQTGDDGQP